MKLENITPFVNINSPVIKIVFSPLTYVNLYNYTIKEVE